MSWLLDADPRAVYAGATPGQERPAGRACATRTGPPPTITYVTTGAPGFPKETLDLLADGKVLRLDDFVARRWYDGRRSGGVSSRLPQGQDKGQRAELDAFLTAVRTGGPMPIAAGVARRHHARPRSPCRPASRRRAGAADGGAMTRRRVSPRLVPAAAVADGAAGDRRPGRGRGPQPALARRLAARSPRVPAGRRAFTADRCRRARSAAVPPDAAKRSLADGGPADGRARRVLRGAPRRHGRPRTGRSTRRPGGGRPPTSYAFDMPYRDEDAIGDVKQIWEPSRHQHLTVLAAAYAADR